MIIESSVSLRPPTKNKSNSARRKSLSALKDIFTSKIDEKEEITKSESLEDLTPKVIKRDPISNYLVTLVLLFQPATEEPETTSGVPLSIIVTSEKGKTNNRVIVAMYVNLDL